jgi:hypothetical protein
MRTSPTRFTAFTRFLGIGSILACSLILAESVTNGALAARRPTSRMPRRSAPIVYNDKPICYAEMTGKGMVNLDKLCGVNNQKKKVIDLSVDADRDGVPDQLLALMRNFNKAMSTAKTPQEYETALQTMESSLPYSDSVKRLQEQQRAIQKQLGNIQNDVQGQALYRQLDSIQQQIFKDPTYRQIQDAMSKVYSKLN